MISNTPRQAYSAQNRQLDDQTQYYDADIREIQRRRKSFRDFVNTKQSDNRPKFTPDSNQQLIPQKQISWLVKNQYNLANNQTNIINSQKNFKRQPQLNQQNQNNNICRRTPAIKKNLPIRQVNVSQPFIAQDQDHLAYDIKQDLKTKYYRNYMNKDIKTSSATFQSLKNSAVPIQLYQRKLNDMYYQIDSQLNSPVPQRYQLLKKKYQKYSAKKELADSAIIEDNKQYYQSQQKENNTHMQNKLNQSSYERPKFRYLDVNYQPLYRTAAQTSFNNQLTQKIRKKWVQNDPISQNEIFVNCRLGYSPILDIKPQIQKKRNFQIQSPKFLILPLQEKAKNNIHRKTAERNFSNVQEKIKQSSDNRQWKRQKEQIKANVKKNVSFELEGKKKVQEQLPMKEDNQNKHSSTLRQNEVNKIVYDEDKSYENALDLSIRYNQIQRKNSESKLKKIKNKRKRTKLELSGLQRIQRRLKVSDAIFQSTTYLTQKKAVEHLINRHTIEKKQRQNLIEKIVSKQYQVCRQKRQRSHSKSLQKMVLGQV